MRRLKRRSSAMASLAEASLGHGGGKLGARLGQMSVGIAQQAIGEQSLDLAAPAR